MGYWHRKRDIVVNAPEHTRDVFVTPSFRRIVDIVTRKLKEVDKLHRFDAIAGCGNSGLPLLGALSYRLGIPMITVRKAGEKTVAVNQTVTGAIDVKSYVLVDDLISSGGTIKRMVKEIADAGIANPVAIILYHQSTCEMSGIEIGGERIPVFGVNHAERDSIRRAAK
jgi:adenine/guanine phosphoribosyltransferase-like PRPP-binding protein